MNERIKELAEQAKLFTGWPNGQVEYQKFAELIIRKCLEIMDDEDDYAIERSARMAAQRVKQHFGIES